MALSLVCTAPHPMIPSLVPGQRVTLLLHPDASVITQITPKILHRLRLAMLAGALAVAHPPDLGAIEADVEARWLQLTGELDRLSVEATLRRAQIPDRPG